MCCLHFNKPVLLIATVSKRVAYNQMILINIFKLLKSHINNFSCMSTDKNRIQPIGSRMLEIGEVKSLNFPSEKIHTFYNIYLFVMLQLISDTETNK